MRLTVDDPAITRSWNRVRRRHRFRSVVAGLALTIAALVDGGIPIPEDEARVRALRAHLALDRTRGQPRARQRDLDEDRPILRWFLPPLIPGYVWRMDAALMWGPRRERADGAHEIRIVLDDADVAVGALGRRRTGLVVRASDGSEIWLLARASHDAVLRLFPG